ncbi:hypothetical protein ACQJBY_068231 [Aegilops geniculata]
MCLRRRLTIILLRLASKLILLHLTIQMRVFSYRTVVSLLKGQGNLLCKGRKMYGCSAGPLRRSKRLNVIQVMDQRDDEDGDCNNGEQFPPGHESQALVDEEGQVHNQVDNEVRKRKRTSLPIVWNMPKGQRIVVKCNEDSQPIGDEGAILGKFLGTIARNGGFCPLNINDWRHVKKNSDKVRVSTIM